MNQKKAKLIRRLAKQQGLWKKEPELVIGNKVKKMIYIKDVNGLVTPQAVERITAINKSRIGYRRLKKAYKNGEFTI